jgi:hypothetical protein
MWLIRQNNTSGADAEIQHPVDWLLKHFNTTKEHSLASNKQLLLLLIESSFQNRQQ